MQKWIELAKENKKLVTIIGVVILLVLANIFDL